MGRTRLRGLEIGGIQIGIEVPETCPWDLPEGRIAEYQCLPREPEVHVGVRAGRVDDVELGGDRYAIGAWTFEVARKGTDWQLGLSRGGRRAQLALFDKDFKVGEVVVDPETARSRSYPLRGPLDEWIVLHRTVAGGGLCLTASALADAGQATIRLGVASGDSANRWSTPTGSFLGRNALIVRETRGQLRLYRTPWTDSIDPALGFEAPVSEFIQSETAPAAFREQMNPNEAAERLVAHAVVPLCDESLLERVLRNARRLGEMAAVSEVGEVASSSAPIAWRSQQLQGGFSPPRGAF